MNSADLFLGDLLDVFTETRFCQRPVRHRKSVFLTTGGVFGFPPIPVEVSDYP